MLGLAIVAPCATTAQAPDLRVEHRSVSPVALQDEVTFEVPAGYLLEVRALSDEFDTVLELHPPEGGEPLRNDDDGASTNSRLSTFAASGGRWRAVVSGYAEGAGAYEFRVSLTSPGDVETIAGRLDADAITSPKGGRYRIHEFTVDSPSDVVLEIDAVSAIEDLIAIAPDGQRFTRGHWVRDDDGIQGGSRVELPGERGRWEVLVTSFGPGESGDYRLSILPR